VAILVDNDAEEEQCIHRLVREGYLLVSKRTLAAITTDLDGRRHRHLQEICTNDCTKIQVDEHTATRMIPALGPQVRGRAQATCSRLHFARDFVPRLAFSSHDATAWDLTPAIRRHLVMLLAKS
jgi:hypothetical protein